MSTSDPDLHSSGEAHVRATQVSDARDHLWLVLAPFVAREDVSVDELLDALLDNDALVMDFLAQGH